MFCVYADLLSMSAQLKFRRLFIMPSLRPPLFLLLPSLFFLFPPLLSLLTAPSREATALFFFFLLSFFSRFAS
ncbi:hypothetical protein BZA05DRAFT_389849 [Tricharina praecox]|uniref:uncharacterized protein n=1 Tax=Tricharina praecox TaxID=43433 RepID=UPI00221F116E|nr:uncharacterized protein BZA05DRAFT_389849 [Tricharina praecox]KAI5855848.1 hypothetical protein BZA05DRAFT_389849 [Tricharina praecox]